MGWMADANTCSAQKKKRFSSIFGSEKEGASYFSYVKLHYIADIKQCFISASPVFRDKCLIREAWSAIRLMCSPSWLVVFLIGCIRRHIQIASQQYWKARMIQSRQGFGTTKL